MRKIVVVVIFIAVVILSVFTPGSSALLSDNEVSRGNVLKVGVWDNTIAAGIEIKPETLNLKSPGEFTAFMTFPNGYDLASINLSTIVCQGAPAIDGNIADKKFIAKFDREDLIGVLPGEEVTFTVTGKLFNGTPFIGSDTIKVIDPGGGK
jgi:hypothetical protein